MYYHKEVVHKAGRKRWRHPLFPSAVMNRTLVVVDFFSMFASFFIAAALRLDFSLETLELQNAVVLGFTVSVVLLVAGFASHLYANRFVRGSMDELFALGKTATISMLIGGGLNVIFGLALGLPRSLVLIAIPIFVVISGGFRLLARIRSSKPAVGSSSAKKAIVYGAGEAAEALIPQLFSATDPPLVPVALLDDSPQKANRWIRGVPMVGTWADFDTVVERFDAEVVIVAIPSASSQLLTRVYEDAHKAKCKVVVLPTLADYLGSSKKARVLRDVNIEDLIGRQPVQLDRERVSRLIEQKRVLVTGAGGSVGSELVAQIASFNPATIVMADRDESGLLAAGLAVSREFPEVRLEHYLVDIRQSRDVSDMFKNHMPHIVFHAAALKHVSMLESFPMEAWRTNVKGTLNLLEAARTHEVSVFVNISTDKAASPINILGKSKKLGEQATAWFGVQTKKPFVSVRFGNVLGSRGSLVPILFDQIAAGGPLTITDDKATRYFMTIPEASQLVLEAAALGEVGDVLVLEMGEPVAIYNLAQRMIELSGESVDIKLIGLRPGEKLHENLNSDEEALVPSSHPKIMKLRARPRSPRSVLASKW